MAMSQLDTEFNEFGKISHITDFADGLNMEFFYGPDDERFCTKLKKANGSLKKETVYLDNLDIVISNTGSKQWFYYVDDHVISRKVDNGTFSHYFTFTDQVGSILKVVDSNGTERFSATYDAWGHQTVTLNEIGLIRGYTGHEMLTEFGLINMNGRVYDPLLGRFLSTDNFVQEPNSTQSFNRYSYCLNNPLKYNDPSGEWLLLSFYNGLFRGIYNMVTGKGNVLSPITESFKFVYNDLKVSWGLFKGSFKQITSRFTWEFPQTYLGFNYSNLRLATEDIDHVVYLDGATFVINDNSHSHKGVTLGNYININDKGSMPLDGNDKFAPQNNPLYMHEYGHYLQSQEYGLGYLVSVGLPSVFSALTADRLPVPPFSTHNEKGFEKSANRKASAYFWEKYGVSWNTNYVPSYWSIWKKRRFYYIKFKDLYPL